MTSRHPVYTFEKRFFELTVNHNGTATISDPERKLEEFPGDIGAATEKIRKHHARVFQHPFNGEAFLKELFDHYLAVLRRQNRPHGSSVPIRLLSSRITSEKRKYLTDRFIVEISKLTREGPWQIGDHRLELEHTLDEKQGMLLHDVDTPGYVGFVRFEEAG
jgi:hypothetical protein